MVLKERTLWSLSGIHDVKYRGIDETSNDPPPRCHQAPFVAKVERAKIRNEISCSFSASGCVVECRICNREVAGSNLGRGYFAPTFTQPSIPPGSVSEYQLRLGRQRQVWLIPIADERVDVQVKL